MSDEVIQQNPEQKDELFGENPCPRLDNEPETWYLRFKRYCRMGPSRSVLGLYNAERAEKGKNKALRPSGAWVRRIEQFEWGRRVKDYDRFIDKIEQCEWDDRRKQFREHELNLAKRLIAKAEQMLQFPVAVQKQEQTTEGGKTIIQTVIMPAKWTFRDAAQIIDTADKLTRLALELDTDRTVVDATVGTPEAIEKVRDRRWEDVKPELREALSDIIDDEEQNDDQDD